MSDPNAQSLNFLVRKDDWATTRFDSAPIGALGADQVLFRVDRFALTSNNITYAAAGDMLDYWGFFPADDGWGRIPAMGFADVVESNHADVRVGERFFGFLPMSTHLVVEATETGSAQFTDGIAHRRNHAPVYRQYQRTSADALYDDASADRILVLRGLFMTSFLVQSFLADNDGFGANTCVIGSASSKTAIALAWLLAKAGGTRVVGVTSPRNQSFVEGLGYYDEVLPYADIKALPADVATAFVDCSGDGDFINTLHTHLGDQLKHHCVVGATHWNAGPRSTDLPGPEPAFFFAPGEIKKRIDAWGPAGFQQRMGEAWRGFCGDSANWMEIRRGAGRAELDRVYHELLDGKASPNEGHVLSVSDENAG